MCGTSDSGGRVLADSQGGGPCCNDPYPAFKPNPWLNPNKTRVFQYMSPIWWRPRRPSIYIALPSHDCLDRRGNGEGVRTRIADNHHRFKRPKRKYGLVLRDWGGWDVEEGAETRSSAGLPSYIQLRPVVAETEKERTVRLCRHRRRGRGVAVC